MVAVNWEDLGFGIKCDEVRADDSTHAFVLLPSSSSSSLLFLPHLLHLLFILTLLLLLINLIFSSYLLLSVPSQPYFCHIPHHPLLSPPFTAVLHQPPLPPPCMPHRSTCSPSSSSSAASFSLFTSYKSSSQLFWLLFLLFLLPLLQRTLFFLILLFFFSLLFSPHPIPAPSSFSPSPHFCLIASFHSIFFTPLSLPVFNTPYSSSSSASFSSCSSSFLFFSSLPLNIVILSFSASSSSHFLLFLLNLRLFLLCHPLCSLYVVLPLLLPPIHPPPPRKFRASAKPANCFWLTYCPHAVASYCRQSFSLKLDSYRGSLGTFSAKHPAIVWCVCFY